MVGIHHFVAQVVLSSGVSLYYDGKYKMKWVGTARIVLLTVDDGIANVTKVTDIFQVYYFENRKIKSVRLAETKAKLGSVKEIYYVGTQ